MHDQSRDAVDGVEQSRDAVDGVEQSRDAVGGVEQDRDAVGGVHQTAQLRVRVSDPDVVFFRSVIEAYDGLVQWTGDGSGVLTLTVPVTQRSALDQLLADLQPELALQVLPE